MLTAILVFVGIIVVGAIALVIIGLRSPETDEELLQARLAEFSARGETANLEEIELSQPFSDRVIYPFARKLGELAIKFTPQNALTQTARKLELAGNPGRMDPTMILALQFIVAGVFGGLLLFVFSISKANIALSMKVILTGIFTILGFYFPNLYLNSLINRRQKSVRKSMPDALDLLTICVEAGLGFDAAISKVAEKWDNELSLAFGRVIREIQLGKLRREALRDMADRLGIPEMTSFVAAVIQSEQLGVSMAKVLRIQSDQMRMKRRQRAEEEAHKAPLKMLIPMTLLIFPSLVIVLVTPAGLLLMKSTLGGMF